MGASTGNKEKLQIRIAELAFKYPKLQELFKLLEQVKTMGNYEMTLQCQDDIGDHLFSFGEFDAALSHFKEQQRAHQDNDDHYWDYFSRIKIAKILFQKGLIEASMDKMFEVLAFNSEELNAYAFNYLSMICLEQGEMEKGDSYLLRSSEIHRRLAKKDRLAENKMVRGKFYQIEGDYVRALQYFNESLLLSRSVENSYSEAYLLLSCAELFMEIKQHKEATRIFRDAFHIANREQFNFIFLRSRIGFALSLMRDGNTFLTQDIFIDCIEQCELYGYSSWQLKALKGLQQCYDYEGLDKLSKETGIKIQALSNKIKNEKDLAILDILAEKEKELKAILVKQNALLEQKKDMEQLRFILSHDLKEPLRNIGNYAGLINKKYKNELGEAGAEYIDIINKATLKLDKLMTGLLSYLSIGVLEVKFKEIDTKELLFEIIRNIEILIGNSQTTIEFDVPEVIYADRKGIYDVFMELIFNSIKFANPDTPPHVKISYSSSDEKTTFKVSDNGQGIERQYLEKINKLFYKLDRQSNEEGIGLGLAKCNKIIQLHGGIMDISSTFGEGTTITFSINNY